MQVFGKNSYIILLQIKIIQNSTTEERKNFNFLLLKYLVRLLILGNTTDIYSSILAYCLLLNVIISC